MIFTALTYLLIAALAIVALGVLLLPVYVWVMARDRAQAADLAEASLHDAALALGVPLRFARISQDADIVINVAAQPLDLSQVGRVRGRLAVIGLGPGAAELMVPAVKTELARCTDVLGYETYIKMAGLIIDGHTIADHCGQVPEAEKARVSLLRAYRRAVVSNAVKTPAARDGWQQKAKRIGCHLANWQQDADGCEGWASLHFDQGLTRLESLGYTVISAI